LRAEKDGPCYEISGIREGAAGAGLGMKNRNFRSVLFKSALALGMGGVCSHDALAQNNPFRDKPLIAVPADKPNIFPEPSIDPAMGARLDALAAAEDWQGLRAAVFSLDDPVSIGKATDWLKLKTDLGGSFIFPFLYARNLWLIGEGTRQTGDETDKGKGLRDQAALMSLYTVALVHMDGMACADATAPSLWLTSLAQSDIRGALRYWSGAPPEFKDQTARIAVGLEAVTARRRKAEDTLLCSNGMAEMDAAMRAGTIGDGKTVPGHLGKVREVKPPAGWKPSFLPADVYAARQDKERGAALYDYLYPVEKAPDGRYACGGGASVGGAAGAIRNGGRTGGQAGACGASAAARSAKHRYGFALHAGGKILVAGNAVPCGGAGEGGRL